MRIKITGQTTEIRAARDNKIAIMLPDYSADKVEPEEINDRLIICEGKVVRSFHDLETNSLCHGISFENENERGIFSSTRKGRGNDELYSFELPPLKFNVTGLVKDEKTTAKLHCLEGIHLGVSHL